MMVTSVSPDDVLFTSSAALKRPAPKLTETRGPGTGSDHEGYLAIICRFLVHKF